MTGVESKVLPSGATYLRIPHTADPAKDAAWLEKVRIEMLDTPDLFRRHILMDDTVISGDPVYTTYQDDWHCPAKFRETGIPIIPGSLFVAGWDCGTSTLNPAMIVKQVLLKPVQVHAILEVTSQGAETMEEFAPRAFQAIERRLPGYWNEVRHYADATVTQKSGVLKGQSAQKEAKRHGFDGNLILRPTSNAPDPRRGAVNWLLSREVAYTFKNEAGEMEERMQAGYWIDAKHCPMYREALLGRYQWKILKPQEGPAGQRYMEPFKNLWSHCLAQGTLVLTKRGSIPIETVETGDYAWTRHGWKRVSRAWCADADASVLRVAFSDGKELVGTSEHLVFANGAFRRVDALQYGMLVECQEDNTPARAERELRSWFTTAFALCATLIAGIVRIACTSREALANASSTCTGISGNRRTARSCLDTTSITSTRTTPIIAWQTMSALPRGSISGGVMVTRCQLPANRLSARLVLPPQSGTSRTRGESGIESIRSGSSASPGPLCAAFASGVAVLMRRPPRNSLGFVRHGAKPLGDGRTGGTMKPVRAWFAAACSKLIGMPRRGPAAVVVLDVCSAGRSAVYDLTVEDAHEFYANGVLVHNCAEAGQYAGLKIRSIIEPGKGIFDETEDQGDELMKYLKDQKRRGRMV